MFNIAASELPDIINKYINNDLIPQKQDHSSATYTKHFFREDGFIPADLLFNVILSPDLIGRRIPSEILKTQGILRLAPQDDLSNLSHLPIFTERACRALSPWPGLWTNVSITKSGKALKTPRRVASANGRMTPQMVKKPEENKRLKILKVHLATTSNLPLKYGYSHTDVAGRTIESQNKVTWRSNHPQDTGVLIVKR